MTIDEGTRIQRALTNTEIQAILAAIENATSTADLLHRAVSTIYDALLTGTGATFAGATAHSIRPTGYAIPASQWQAIMRAVTDRAAQWGTGAELGLNLVNLMPSSYDDPAVPAPAVPAADHRPYVHQLHVTREATDTIAACDTHVQALGQHYGHQSEIYTEALTSWHHQLARLFSMNLGAETRISRDGPLSLLVFTGSGFTFGVIFHGTRRRCTTTGCAATITDGGAAQPAYPGATVAEHEHQPSHPLDAPQPGEWSFHS
ncbi:MAG: hypothetical protein QOJ50_1899 [Cryptosporangiaceae bacterium]|nr:hypothetical protein [Cryptosporangiaceae bacterium]